MRRFVLKLRDLFFQWIPREIIVEALSNIKAGLGSLLGALLGFVWGLWDAISDSTLPYVTVVLLVIAPVLGALIWEVLAMVYAWSWSPSALLIWTAIAGYAIGKGCCEFIISLLHIKTIAGAILAAILGFVPTELIGQAWDNLWTLTWNALTSIPTGFKAADPSMTALVVFIIVLVVSIVLVIVMRAKEDIALVLDGAINQTASAKHVRRTQPARGREGHD